MSLHRGAFIVCLAVACAPSPATPSAAKPDATVKAPALELGVLHELVPAAGLRWLLHGHPARVSENPELASALTTLLPAERLQRYATNTGVDLRKLPSAVVAGFDLGTLYLAELPSRSHEPLTQFVARLGGREVLERPHPNVVRATGTVAGEPQSFVDLDGMVVAFASGDVALTRIPAAFAMGKLANTRPALQGAALSTLPALSAGALVTFYAPGPFEDEWARAARGLLAAALGVAVWVETAPDGYLRFTLVVSGDWQHGGSAAAERLELAFRDLAESSTGELLALDHARALRTSAHPQYLTLSAEVPLEALTRGLRAAVIADVWEMLELPAKDGTRPEAVP